MAMTKKVPDFNCFVRAVLVKYGESYLKYISIEPKGAFGGTPLQKNPGGHSRSIYIPIGHGAVRNWSVRLTAGTMKIHGISKVVNPDKSLGIRLDLGRHLDVNGSDTGLYSEEYE